MLADWHGSGRGFFENFLDTRQPQNSPTNAKKKEGLPRPPQVRRIPVPKDNLIVVYHEEPFCRDGH